MLQSYQVKLSHVVVLLACFVMLALTASTASANELNGNMRIDRAVKSGADECYRTISRVKAKDSIMLLGRNADASWVFIWASTGDGWVPTDSVEAYGNVYSLSIWADHFVGEQCKTEEVQYDVRVCGRPGNTRQASTVRWTDIFTTADPALHTGRAYTPNVSLNILGRDFWGCWVSVSGGGDAGWVPVDALSDRGVMSLPVLVDNSQGCKIQPDGRVLCPKGVK